MNPYDTLQYESFQFQSNTQKKHTTSVLFGGGSCDLFTLLTFSKLMVLFCRGPVWIKPGWAKTGVQTQRLSWALLVMRIVMVDFYLEIWPFWKTLETCRAKQHLSICVFNFICCIFCWVNINHILKMFTRSFSPSPRRICTLGGFWGPPTGNDKMSIWYQSQAFGKRPKSNTLVQLHLLSAIVDNIAHGAETSCHRRRGLA